MTSSPSLDDDEALWFPVLASTGDSFTRGTSPDGGAAGDDDGIGLPGRTNGRGPRRGGPPKKGGGRASRWLWLTLWGAAAVGIVGYAARKDIAAEIVTSWLRSQGADAHIKLDRLSLSHTSGTIYVGDEANPELSIKSFDVDYSLDLFAGKGMPLARVKTLHIINPVMRFSYLKGKLNFGALDKLVQNALTAKPTGAPPPDEVKIDDARIQLTTDYGVVNGTGDIDLTQGQLSALTVSVAKTHLKGTLGEGDLNAARITARSVPVPGRGDQLHVTAAIDAQSLNATGNAAEDADTQVLLARDVILNADVLVPYRAGASIADTFNGATSGTLSAKAGQLTTAGTTMSGVEETLDLAGTLKLSDTSGNFTGAGRMSSRADAVQSGGLDARSVFINSSHLAITAAQADGVTTVSVNGPAGADIGRLTQGDLHLEQAHVALSRLNVTSDADGVKARFAGTAAAKRLGMTDLALDGITATVDGTGGSDSDGTWNLALHSDVASDHGSYAGLKPLVRDRLQARADLMKKPAPGAPATPAPDMIVALDNAFERFSLRARALDITLHGTGAGVTTDVRSGDAIRLGLNGGGTAVLTPVAGKPILPGSGRGAFNIAVDGGGLPSFTLGMDDFGPASAGSSLLSGRYHLAGDFTFDPVRDAHIDGSGRFVTTSDGGFNLTLDDGAGFTAKSAEIADHLTDLSGRLAQTGPLFMHYGPSGYHVYGAFRDVSLSAPNEVVALSHGGGTFEAYSLGPALGYKAHLATATVSDASPANATRFNPLLLSGDLTQDARTMTGRFGLGTPSVRTPQGTPLSIAAIDLNGDSVTGSGTLGIHTLDLSFRPDGLQPAYLSPAVAALLSKDVTGGIAFTGRFDWTKDTTASSGVLTLDGLNFTGATGVSKNLHGKINFTSLSPLLSDPGQVVAIDEMNVGLPLNDMNLSVQFLADRIVVEGADVQSPGGPVRLEPMGVPLAPDAAISGAVAFDGLDFGKIIAATNLKDSMTFKGDLSGRLPFTISAGHVTFANGHMAADGPGQISVKRQSVVAPAQTTATITSDAPPATAKVAAANAQAAQAADPNFNPFQDLAFQALEYITYDQMDAKLNSKPGGILDVNFHIKGYFDPPQKQKAKISLFDYISGAWMKKPIKLPSKTPVELYLDVPVNLDEILNDLTQFNVNTAAKPKNAG